MYRTVQLYHFGTQNRTHTNRHQVLHETIIQKMAKLQVAHTKEEFQSWACVCSCRVGSVRQNAGAILLTIKGLDSSPDCPSHTSVPVTTILIIGQAKGCGITLDDSSFSHTPHLLLRENLLILYYHTSRVGHSLPSPLCPS